MVSELHKSWLHACQSTCHSLAFNLPNSLPLKRLAGSALAYALCVLLPVDVSRISTRSLEFPSLEVWDSHFGDYRDLVCLKERLLCWVLNLTGATISAWRHSFDAALKKPLFSACVGDFGLVPFFLRVLLQCFSTWWLLVCWLLMPACGCYELVEREIV